MNYSTLAEIIEALNPSSVGNPMTYVGKNYTKEALIGDLVRVGERQQDLLELAWGAICEAGYECYAYDVREAMDRES